MKNIEKYIMMILVFVAVGAIGAAVYFGINADKDDSSNIENKQEEVINDDENDEQLDENELISFCKKNKSSIILDIKEFRKTNFISKYYPNNYANNEFSYKMYYSENGKKTELAQSYSLANADDIDCISASYGDNENVVIISFNEDKGAKGGIKYSLDEKNVISEFVTDMEGDYEINEYFSFVYAKDKMFYDLSQKYNNLGIYAQEYNGGDTRLFSICDYGAGGEEGCLGEKYAVYEYNYKTDTYYKVN